MWDLMDYTVATYYGIGVKEYINKVEGLSWSHMNFVILVALGEKDEKKERALNILNK
jgi:hypothetical protein